MCCGRDSASKPQVAQKQVAPQTVQQPAKNVTQTNNSGTSGQFVIPKKVKEDLIRNAQLARIPIKT